MKHRLTTKRGLLLKLNESFAVFYGVLFGLCIMIFTQPLGIRLDRKGHKDKSNKEPLNRPQLMVEPE
jgi:hypothetical protein